MKQGEKTKGEFRMEPNYRYVRRTTVPGYGCDLKNQLKLSYLLKEVQQISTEQLDRLGITYRRLFEENKVFVLARLGLEIFRMPGDGEEMILRTSPQGTRGAQFLREILIETAAGERLANVQTSWLLVDPADRRIHRPNQFGYTLPTIPEELRMQEDYSARRIQPKGEEIGHLVKEVRYSDMDVNRHLNNTVYADLVTDVLPLELMGSRTIRQFVINYQKEARQGEQIDVHCLDGGDGWYYIVGRKAEDRCFEAMVQFADEL